jgi:hypothetical protein
MVVEGTRVLIFRGGVIPRPAIRIPRERQENVLANKVHLAGRECFAGCRSR